MALHTSFSKYVLSCYLCDVCFCQLCSFNTNNIVSFKSTEFHTLNELFEKDPEKKVPIIKHMKEELMKVLDK